MDLREHVANVAEAFDELEATVADLDRATDRRLLRLLVYLGIHPDSDAVVRRSADLSAAVTALREAVEGEHADLDDAVQSGSGDTPDDWEELRLSVLRRDDWGCQNCGHTGGPNGDATLHAHHVVPVARGGRSQLSNLITLCERCHVRAHGGG